jgi:hypothetical protein
LPHSLQRASTASFWLSSAGIKAPFRTIAKLLSAISKGPPLKIKIDGSSSHAGKNPAERAALRDFFGIIVVMTIISSHLP